MRVRVGEGVDRLGIALAHPSLGTVGANLSGYTVTVTGPDDAVRIEPGHDAWVVGDVPCVAVDFGIAPDYARHDE